MSCLRECRRASLSLNLLKSDEYINESTSPQAKPPDDSFQQFPQVPGLSATTTGSVLTPDVAQSLATPFPPSASVAAQLIGNYLLQRENTTSSLTSSLPCYDAIDITTGQEFTCKVLPLSRYRELLAVYFRAGSHPHIISLHQVIVGSACVYAMFPRHYGDLHSYVRSARRLREAETVRLFGQIVSVVIHCHAEGIVLRDLKLRKFVFKDADRTQLMLESLDDACLLEDLDNDLLSDRHGCPAYVSPEILSDESYSGRSADVWSLGVILFTMLVGRYPFHDSDPVALFRAIRLVRYVLPRQTVSAAAQCLLRWLLRADPAARPAACEIPAHPWLRALDITDIHNSPRRYNSASGNTASSGSAHGSTGMSGSTGRSVSGVLRCQKLSDGERSCVNRCNFADQIVPEISMFEFEANTGKCLLSNLQ